MQEVHDWDEYTRSGIGSGSYTDDTVFQRHLKGPRVLEVGCGVGRYIAKLPSAFERFGIDPSEEAIASAQARYPDAIFSTGDAMQLAFPDNYFDTVYALEVIEHLAAPEKFLAEAHRVLRPGGMLYIQTPNYPTKRAYDVIHWLRGMKSTPADDYTHVSPFSYRKLKRAIARAGFSVVETKTRNILLENRLPFLKRLRASGAWLGLLIGQKTIVVGVRKA